MLVAAIAPGVWSCLTAAEGRKKKYDFIPYQGPGLAPVVRVTPDDGFYVHTYYDVCPWSPSGRYLAASRLPYQDHNAVLGDTADVCLIDTGEQTIETLHGTKVWAFQTGTNANWGGSDRYLYTNDLVDGVAACARIDLQTREVRLFAGPMYNVAPDDSYVIAFPLELLDATQLGYGTPSRDPEHPPTLSPGASKTQGLWRTDLKTNQKRLLVSLAQLAARVPEPPPRPDGTWYLWHSKHNRQGTRILQISRTLFPDGSGGRNTIVFTLKPDGSDIYALPTRPIWGTDGGHPNWHGDGEHVIRNLPVEKTARICQWRYDGSGFRLLSEKLKGGGHPRIEPSGRYVVTDAFSDDQLTLRLLDVRADREEKLCTIRTFSKKALQDSTLRLDGHPAFSRDFRKVCFQAAPEGRRQLFVADLSRILA